jgi:hypothetical protein
MQQANRSIDNRRKARIPASLPVHFGSRACDIPGAAENLSEEGLYINTNRIFPVGTTIQLEIQFPDCTIFHHAKVVWAIQVPEHQREELICGMGVEFVGHNPEWYPVYRRWRGRC